MDYRIPFNRPFLAGRELEYVEEAVRRGHCAGDGEFTRRCESILAERFGAERVLLTTSCTTALEMAALLADIRPGDEVVVPSFTFVSTANAFVLRGARPIFADIRADTLNLDEGRLEGLLTDRTKAVVPVHYGSVACDMDSILEVAHAHGALVIEDAAQAVNARYGGRFLGTVGDLGTYSFHETKNFSCGEGGALVFPDGRYVERAEVLREKGTNRARFFRGQVDKYTWVDVGSSFLPSDILAAFLFAQLENLDAITDRRRGIYERYARDLAPLADRGIIRLPIVPPDCSPSYHLFYVLTADLDTRSRLIDHLRDRGILAVFHYVPLHTSPMGQQLGYRPGMLPVTEEMSDRVLRLPFYYELTESDQNEVVSAMFDFFGVERAKE